MSEGRKSQASQRKVDLYQIEIQVQTKRIELLKLVERKMEKTKWMIARCQMIAAKMIRKKRFKSFFFTTNRTLFYIY